MKLHFLPIALIFISGIFPQFVSAQTSNSAPTNGQVSTAPGAATAISAPTNTVGNTPSSVSAGSHISGNSAGGSNVNTNINNTQTVNRSNAKPNAAARNTGGSFANGK